MLRILCGAAFVLALASPAIANTTRLAPSSPWQINYADDSCRLARVFGTDTNRIYLMLDRFEPSETFQFLMAGNLVSRAQGMVSTKLTFGPGEDEQSYQLIAATQNRLPAVLGSSVVLGMRAEPEATAAARAQAQDDAGGKKATTPEPSPRFQPMTPEREAAVRYIEITGASRRPIVLETGPMGEPMAAMRRCTEELLTHWGIDVEAHRGISRGPRPISNPGQWFGSGDYPHKMVMEGVEGLIRFRLIIEDDGRIGGCHIQQSTRPAEFDRAVCNAMTKRGKFTPALDADGRPIRSYWRSSVRFMLD